MIWYYLGIGGSKEDFRGRSILVEQCSTTMLNKTCEPTFWIILRVPGYPPSNVAMDKPPLGRFRTPLRVAPWGEGWEDASTHLRAQCDAGWTRWGVSPRGVGLHLEDQRKWGNSSPGPHAVGYSTRGWSFEISWTPIHFWSLGGLGMVIGYVDLVFVPR